MNGTRKILIVENNAHFGAVLRYQLQALGFSVEEAADGRCALQRCSQDNYSLVVADCNVALLARDLRFVQLLRLRYPDIPVLVLSAFSSPENVATAFRYGASDFLEKPYDPVDLKKRVERVSAQAR